MLIAAQNVSEFFREALTDSLKRKSISISREAEVYLVNLLAEFMRSEKAYAGIEFGDKPALATLFGRAQEAEKSESLSIFKYLGDSSLYFISFFEESKERQHVGASYYIGMGKSAYQSASALIRDSSATSAALFAELGDRFSDLVSVLQDADTFKNPSSDPSPDQLVDMINQYKTSNSPKLLDKLSALGILTNNLVN